MPAPCTLHPAPCTLHPAPCTLLALASFLVAAFAPFHTLAANDLAPGPAEPHTDRALILHTRADGTGRADGPENPITLYHHLRHTAAPVPAAVRQAAARALRDARRWPEALALWREGLAQHPEAQPAFTAGLVLTLADAGHIDEAIQTGLDGVEQAPDSADLRLALAYAYTRQGRAYEALFHADQARQLAPQAGWVQREYVLALQRAGVSGPAWRLAQAQRDLFTPAQWRALDADAAALKTRLAVMPTRREAERPLIADRALARYAALIPDWQAQGGQAAADAARLRVDRLSALHARARMAEVVREYDALRAEGIELPAWARAKVADAYLSLREPERARDLYRAILAELDATTAPEQRHHLGPAAQRLELETGLFYALVEAGQFDELNPVLARIQGYGPAWLHFNGQPRPGANTRYLDAQLMLVSAQMALDDTPAAQARMEALLKAAPNNTRLREQLAGIYRARALPRRAERQLKLAETMTPRALAVEINQGVVALDLQEWRQVELLSADTLARAPDSQAAQALARQWAVHNMAELRIHTSHGLAAGNQVTGSDGLGLDAVAYTAPINDHWRLYAGSGHAQGRFAEGPGHLNRQRAGAEWRGRDWTIEGELSANSYGRGARTGARLTLIHDLDDHWRIGGDIERLSRNSPLRALRDGVTSDTLGAYARWRAHERREWWLSLTSARFSDRNRRLEFDLDGRERVYTGPRLQLDALLSLSAQTNSSDAERLYFNPKRAFALLPALRARHTLHQRYERVWQHEASVAAGAVHQRGYGTGRMLALSYGQRWRGSEVFDFGASVRGVSRPYDGTREREWQLLLDLNLRF